MIAPAAGSYKSHQYGVRKIPGKWECYFPSLTRYIKGECMVCNDRENTRNRQSPGTKLLLLIHINVFYHHTVF